MSKFARFVLAVVAVFSVMPAFAAVSPLGVSIFPPLEFPPESFSVAGVRASALWGKNRNTYGVDLGVLGNITDLEFAGIAVSGVFNATHGNTTIVGLQLAGITNINVEKTGVYGAQIAAGVNSNQAASTVVGVQLGAIANLNPHTDIYGLEVGLYNQSYSVHGLQVGLINFTQSLHGLQIGLLNFNHDGLFVVSPFLNFGF